MREGPGKKSGRADYTSEQMVAHRLRVTQAESHSLIGHPTLEHGARAERNGSLESHIQRAGPRKCARADFGSAARQRPHAVCNGAFKPEKTGRDIRDVNGIEIPGHARVLTPDPGRDHKSARADVLSGRHVQMGKTAL